MRRNRIRSSVTSTRSSASDRTITNEFLNLSDELSPDGGTSVGAHCTEYGTSHPEDQSRNPTRHKTLNRRDQNTASNSALDATTDSTKVAAMLDPTYVAQKILAETRPQRQALEFMQKWSVDKLQQKRMASAQNDHCKNDDTPSQSHECHPSLPGQFSYKLTDCDGSSSSLLGGSSSAVSQPSNSMGNSVQTKNMSCPETIKSEVTYANIPFSKHPINVPSVSSFVQPERSRSFNQVGSGTGNTSGQNAAFRGSGVATSKDNLRSCGSTPWLNTPSLPAGGQTAVKRASGCSSSTETGSVKSADSSFSQPSLVVGSKSFMTSSSVNVAPSSGALQTGAEELCLPDDWNDSDVKRNATKQVLSPDGQAHAGDSNDSVDLKCSSAMKSIHRPNKQKTVKFQDEIETMSLSSDEPSAKVVSCVVKNTGSGSVANVIRDNGAQRRDCSVGEIGKSPEDSPVMYKPPPPYPGPGRKLPSTYRASQCGTIEGSHPTGNATPVSNGYREHSLQEPFHDKYNDHVSGRNGHNDQLCSPVRRGAIADSSTTPVDDEMGDLNSRQNLKRMSMHMYTSSDDSTTSAGHRLNGVAHKRVTENFQRFQARTCNGDATPNTNFATSTPSFSSMQNGVSKCTPNYPDTIGGGDRRREHDWQPRTCVPGSRGERRFNRSRHIQDPSTLPSSQC